MTKIKFECETGTETVMEGFLMSFQPQAVSRFLRQAGCKISTTLVSDGFSFSKEVTFYVTMDVLSVVNAKGYRVLGDRQMKADADALVDLLNDAVSEHDTLPDLMQKCSDCGNEKPLSEFYRNRTKKLGVNNICKECQKRRNWKQPKQKPADEE